MIAHTHLASASLLALISAYRVGASVHKAFCDTAFPSSITTAYRWIKRWLGNIGVLRAQLSRAHPPPRGPFRSSTGSTLQHLLDAFPDNGGSIRAFQHHNQRHFLR